MMDVSSMYGNHHHHHSNNFHNAGNDVNTVATAAAAARNGYSNAYFPVGGTAIGQVQHTQSPYTQHVHPLSYSSYNSNSAQYYQQQQQHQHQHQQQQSVEQLQQQQKQHTTPPLVQQLSMSPEQQQHQQQSVYSHSHLFSPSAAEYGIVSSSSNGATTGNTPNHVPSHSPSESYYESDSMHSYYATAAVASVPSSTNSPIAAQSSTPNMPPIISSENGLSYTNLDCLYNQNPNQQSQLQHQQYDYGTMAAVNCNNSEEKYANVLNASFGGPGVLVDESNLSIENCKQQASNHVWHHHHHQHHLSGGYALQDPTLTIESMNMHSHVHSNITNLLPQNAQSSQVPVALCDEITANHHSSNCMASRSQQVISPDGSTSQSNTGGQSKSPNHASNLPTYKWMQLKRNVPKPQRK